MSQESPKLNVVVTYGQLKAEFTGNLESVMLSVNNFLIKNIPGLDLAREISVDYSTSELIKMFKDVIKITPEGPRVWIGEFKLSDKDISALQLIATKIGFDTGKLSSPSLTLAEIQSYTSLKSKSISSRLSEMSKAGLVEKEATEQGVRYKITTQGIHWLSTILPKKIGIPLTSERASNKSY